jgi:hypothetical protein
MTHIASKWFVVAAFGAALLAPIGADAASIEPFPGDDTGCLPDTHAHYRCQREVGRAAIRLIQSVLACHVRQASAAFRDDRFDEERCEDRARDQFDHRVEDVVDGGECFPGTADRAAELRDVLTEDPQDSLDARNGGIYCDSASGALIDSASGAMVGDDRGFVPNSRSNLRCANEVAGELADLARDVIRCHIETADRHEDGKDFDEEGCEDAARHKFDSEIDETLDQAKCPDCLDKDHQQQLGDSLIALLDEKNELIFPCPGGSPSGAFLEADAPAF